MSSAENASAFASLRRTGRYFAPRAFEASRGWWDKPGHDGVIFDGLALLLPEDRIPVIFVGLRDGLLALAPAVALGFRLGL
jgi:hypothetical protein